MKKEGFTLVGTLIAIFAIAVFALSILGILSNQNFLISKIVKIYENEGKATQKMSEWFLRQSGNGSVIVRYDLNGVEIKLVESEFERSTGRTFPNKLIRFEAE